MAARSVLSIQYLTFSKRAYSSKVDKNVAFLGLGNMGKYMAANLVKQVRIYFCKRGFQRQLVDIMLQMFLGSEIEDKFNDFISLP